MSIFSHSSSKLIFSLKVLTISTAVFFMAVMLKLLFPLAISQLPSILNVVDSWLRPPYLYIVINCIIITIVATSKLQSKLDHYAFSPPPQPIKAAPLVYATSGGVDVLNSDELAAVAAMPLFDFGYAPSIEKIRELDLYGKVETKFPETKKTIVLNNSKEMPMKFSELSETKKTTVLDSSANSSLGRDPMAPTTATTELTKPPASARFSHRKGVKTTPEGVKTLGVSKPKRNETLESTWKTITDGRPMPLTRHLHKSDARETHHRTGIDLHINNDNINKMTKSETFNDRTGIIDLRNNNDNINKIMTKSETFNDCSSSRKSTLARSSGSGGKLKKDPSLGQEELNKRVEAFISKFNEEMRLQRQESMNQYLEMINRGAGH